MDANDFANRLLQELEQAKANGTENFATDFLITYVKEKTKGLEGEPTAAGLEVYKLNLQAFQAQNIEMFKSVITAGQNALRTSLLINGGASVAILTFIGSLATSLATKTPLMDPKLLATPLAIFVVGTFLGAVASGVTYFVQLFYAEATYRPAEHRQCKRKVGHFLNLLAIMFGFASYCFFVYGAYIAYGVFKRYA